MKLIKEYILPRLIVDIIFFYAALMLVALLAIQVEFEAKLIWGFVANYLMLVFAFIINDIEDRDEDRESEYEALTFIQNIKLVTGISVTQSSGKKRFSNPFAKGVLSPQVGRAVLVLLALASLVSSWLFGGYFAVLVAASNLLVGILYSLRSIRLKSVPVFDILSHAYLLAAVQVLFFFTYGGANLNATSYLLLVFVFVQSVSGDLNNEYRDFDEDQAAGIRNTSTLLGKRITYLIGRILYFASATVLVVVVVNTLLKVLG